MQSFWADRRPLATHTRVRDSHACALGSCSRLPSHPSCLCPLFSSRPHTLPAFPFRSSQSKEALSWSHLTRRRAPQARGRPRRWTCGRQGQERDHQPARNEPRGGAPHSQREEGGADGEDLGGESLEACGGAVLCMVVEFMCVMACAAWNSVPLGASGCRL